MMQNNINDEKINENILSVNKSRQYIDVNIITGYCAKCGKPLEDINDENNKYIIKDENNNLFCDKICRSEYWNEIRREVDDRYYGWNRR